ncbi:Malonyl-[acyl-carrier protein] O-methyltransferase [Candidatus Providencia siddallii]|uniref:Malonyl-[acyl-carrier protein] O-methyltransferase n=1 Tax=Candidatus Providencia siddallii TaxID=1715285 RepID=A0A0M6W990_9GAMM|nr:Malonyl-[acyl-carrier protein] O-methyltransferase [Candidatus Providencia siddallii]
MTLCLYNEKRKIADAFTRAAKKYDLIATYQKDIGYQLLYKLEYELKNRQRNKFFDILDAGCGTGFFSKIMRDRGLKVTALDLSSGMIEVAKNKDSACNYLCADIESMPTENNIFDVVFSNLAIQWCSNLNKTLHEFYRVTKIGGIIVFTTLAENTLNELSEAWKILDDFSHVNNFLSYREIVRCCEIWRNQLYIQKDTIYFRDINSLLYSLKGVGATHLNSGRKSRLITKRSLIKLSTAYQKINHMFPLTYHTVFGVIYRD